MDRARSRCGGGFAGSSVLSRGVRGLAVTPLCVLWRDGAPVAHALGAERPLRRGALGLCPGVVGMLPGPRVRFPCLVGLAPPEPALHANPPPGRVAAPAQQVPAK